MCTEVMRSFRSEWKLTSIGFDLVGFVVFPHISTFHSLKNGILAFKYLPDSRFVQGLTVFRSEKKVLRAETRWILIKPGKWELICWSQLLITEILSLVGNAQNKNY